MMSAGTDDDGLVVSLTVIVERVGARVAVRVGGAAGDGRGADREGRAGGGEQVGVSVAVDVVRGGGREVDGRPGCRGRFAA